MSIGRTNAGVGGGGSWSWYAYIQVSTDANASITAVNPAGNSYTKTADANGSCTCTVAYPGTYTISETGATSQTVVVADYGVIYPVSINIPTFDGKLITDGVATVSYTASGMTGTNLTAKTPSLANLSREGYNCILVSLGSSGAGMYVSTNAYSIGSYSDLVLIGQYGESSCGMCAVLEGETSAAKRQHLQITSFGTFTMSLSDLDRTKKYKFGVFVYSGSESAIWVNNLKLQ